MNRIERIQEILRLEGVATAARRQAEQRRAELDAEARAELEAQGTAPTWRIPGLGTVSLPVSKEAAVVADTAAFAAWCAQRHSANVETVTVVRPAFQAALLARVVCDGDVVVDPDTGEAIPGLAVRPGGQPRALTIRADRDVTRAAAELGEQMLESMALLAGETPGHLEPGEVDTAQPGGAQ